MTPVKNVIKVAIAFFALTATAAFAEPIEIKFSHVVAANTPKGQMAVQFKNLVEQRLPGKVSVKIFPNSELFSDGQVLDAMIRGEVQLAAPSLSKFDNYTKKLQIFDLPFLFEDMPAVERFQNGAKGQELLSSLEEKGLVGLGYLHNGMKQMSANTPLVVPADAKGKTFRIQSSDVLAAQFEAVGATPLKKPFSEVFSLLQNKEIDGQENTWSNIYSKKFFEVQNYISETNHGVLDYLVVTSKAFWMSLPEDIRPIVKASLDEAILMGNRIAQKKANADKRAIAKSGQSKLVNVSKAARHQWVMAMKPVWAKFENDIGKDMIDAAASANK